MKRVFSIVLTLIFVMSLCVSAGISAFADEGDETITIVVTGGVGTSVNSAELSYASAAALRDSIDQGDVLLVDAGGFDLSAAPIISAAGYDLVVPADIIDGWDVTSISMGIEELSGGAYVAAGGKTVAFIGVIPQGEQNKAIYYNDVQELIDMAAEGADYVILLGAIDVAAMLENVTGADAILTYAESAATADESSEDAEAVSEDEEVEQTEDTEPVDDGAETENKPVVGVVLEDFGSIGVVTIGADGITFESMDKEAYDALELTESEEILALEAAWTPADTEPVEETEPPEETEPVEETEQPEETEPVEETEQPEETEPVEETEQPEETEPVEETEQPEETEPVEETEQPEETEPVEESGTDGDAEETTTTPEATETEPAQDTAPVFLPIEYNRTGDLVFSDLPGSVTAVHINSMDYELDSSLYSVSADGRTVTVTGQTFDSWQNGAYDFMFSLSDSSVITKRVEMSGEAPVRTNSDPTQADGAANAQQTTAPTDSANSPTPTNSAAPTGSTPATGDTTPIGLYVGILAVLVAALVVVVVLVIRSKKK